MLPLDKSFSNRDVLAGLQQMFFDRLWRGSHQSALDPFVARVTFSIHGRPCEQLSPFPLCHYATKNSAYPRARQSA
jgi:hypothetical protein